MTVTLPPTFSRTAMVLAAGQGMRMRPLTLSTPKPLLQVGGRTMLDSAIDKLRDAGITRVVVNAWYLADQIIAHLAQRTDVEIIISREEDLLDTGGGIKNALHHFGDLPFFALNADLPWIDTPDAPSLPRMAQNFDAATMDALLLMKPTTEAHGFSPRGDYIMEPDGRAHRHDAAPPFPHVMIGAQIVKPEFYAAIPDTVFSNARVWDMAEKAGRLYGMLHHGTCYHVGTPQDWEQANAWLASGRGWG